MRWFVEVSRVGDNGSDEKYCVEAKQWQAALQEARKLRGDSGPLSKFSIELLDDGYRAVDPKQKLRYVVAKAPQDAELSSYGETPHKNGQEAAGALTTSSAPRPSSSPLTAVAPTNPPPAAHFAFTAPSASPAPGSLPSAPASSPLTAPASLPLTAPASSPLTAPASSPLTAPSLDTGFSPPRASIGAAETPPPPPIALAAEPHAGVPSSALSPNAPPSGVHVSAAASAAPESPGNSKSPSAFPARPLGSVRSHSARPAGITVPVDAIPPAPPLPQGIGAALPPQNHTQPSPVIDLPPPSSVLRKRQEEPTPEAPITYREIAHVVEPGVTRASVEALLWASFRDVSRELADRPGQKFVQLAVFDHRFERRPERPPLGTLSWKDWRGNPVLTFPYFDGTAHVRPSGIPPSVLPPAPAPSIVPVPVVPVTSSPPAPTPPPTAPSAVAGPIVIGPPSAAGSIAPAAPSVIASAPAVAFGKPATQAVVAPASASPAVAPAAAAVGEAPAIPLTREKLSSSHPPPAGREKLASHPGAARGSRPRMAAVQRRAGEDLIGELFETMHDLHFMSGVADGAEFVLAAVDSVVPCDGILIHVFDINSRQFVVVRAKGPGTMQVLLHRTPDSDPFFSSVMRRPGSIAIHDVNKDGRVLGARWDALGVRPTRALCAPVRQGGRYLGLLEVVNPMGDAPFHQNEQNAIDYVCEQFAAFLANRPIVLDADVILRR